MYAAHFGLREPPFAITPDPAYVYLSRHHREALAHLLYGTGENGGFVQLTGEVGTGKTTWGNQIRSYVLHPYKQVKDLRTKVESKHPEKVLDGDLDAFIEAELRLAR